MQLESWRQPDVRHDPHARQPPLHRGGHRTAGSPPPGLFQQSLGFVDKDGFASGMTARTRMPIPRRRGCGIRECHRPRNNQPRACPDAVRALDYSCVNRLRRPARSTGRPSKPHGFDVPCLPYVFEGVSAKDDEVGALAAARVPMVRRPRYSARTARGGDNHLSRRHARRHHLCELALFRVAEEMILQPGVASKNDPRASLVERGKTPLKNYAPVRAALAAASRDVNDARMRSTTGAGVDSRKSAIRPGSSNQAGAVE